MVQSWSFPGLIVAGSIFILAQFFKAIPKALEEAAVIDGASYFPNLSGFDYAAWRGLLC